MDELRPFAPRPERPWDRAAATHLLRRAGFCPSEREIVEAHEAGVVATVDRLIKGGVQSERARDLNALGERLAARNEIELLRGWWLSRMRYTERPLHSRLACFWHGHFATSNAKVARPSLMFGQLRAIERHALGRFEDLVLAMGRDPAMIVWLDGNRNVKGRPNENFARELLELFTLGVGNYSESDIKEAARAFTGWSQRRGRFHFVRHDHDGGPKRVLGEAGELTGEDVIRIASRQAACSRFLSMKLLREFLTPDPDDQLVESFALALREKNLEIASGLRTLLTSEAFFDPRFRRARIKSPVEFVIGLARSLELDVPAASLAATTSDMGQRLFEPPTVAGWKGGRTWLDSATMLVRLNTAQRAAEQVKSSELASRYALASAEMARRFSIDLTLDESVPNVLLKEIARFDGSPAEVLSGALALAVSAPEYQLA